MEIMGDSTQLLDIPSNLDQEAIDNARKLLDSANPEDIARLSDDNLHVNKILKTRYSGQKPTSLDRLPMEPPEITNEMRSKIDMADARKAYKDMPVDLDDVDDVRFDLEKLERYKRADGAIRSPRAEVLKQVKRGFGRAARPIGKTLGVVSKAAAAAPPLSLLSTEEANAGSTDLDEQMALETEMSPEMGEAKQEGYNLEANEAERFKTLRKLLGR